MKNITPLALAIASSVPLFMSVSAPLNAAESLALEEIIVTARKRLELQQDVPISTTVFSETAIERAGIERPQDFISLTSNVTIVDTANAGDTQVTIRGITSTRDAEGTFAYVLDGVLITNPNGFNGELFDIQSIEVLKGPQGALYGRNAVAGAILINTKEPSSEFGGNVKLGAGDDGLFKLGTSISGPLSDTARAGISLSTRDYDGQFTNDFTGSDDSVTFTEEQNIRARMIWDVTDNLVIDATVSRREVEGGAINFNAVFALPDAATNFGDPNLYKDVNDHDSKFQFNVPGENEQENTFWSIKADYEMETMTLTGIIAHDELEEYLISDGTSAAFGIYSFDLAAGVLPPDPAAGAAQQACGESYQDFDASSLESPFFAFPGAVPGVAVDLGIAPFYGLNALLPPYTSTTCDGYQYQQRDQESSSIEIRLSSEDLETISWTAGFYVAKIEREVAVSYGADVGDGIFPKTPYVPGRTDLLFWDDFETDVFAIFGSIEWEINEEHTVSLAGRYDEEDRSVSNNVPNVQAAQAFGGISPITFTPATINPAFDGSFTDTIADRDETYSQFQPKLSWRWSFMDEASLYASYGLGFRSGGFNNVGSSALVEAAYPTITTRPANLNDDYEKEVSTSFELGVKSEWMDNRLRVNAAVFRTEIEDSQFFNFLAGSFGILRVVTNIDEVEVQGFEADFQFAVAQGLTVYGALGLTDSEITENANRPYTEGNDAPLTPDSTMNLGVEWVNNIGNGVDLVTRLDWQRIGETWFSTVQDETTLNAFTDVSATYQGIGAVFGDVDSGGPGIPPGGIIGFGTSRYDKGQRDAYELVNLRIGIEAEAWTITAWSNNLLDEDYLEEIIPAPEFGGYFVHPANGVSYGADFTYRF